MDIGIFHPLETGILSRVITENREDSEVDSSNDLVNYRMEESSKMDDNII